ncbi:MAG: hypothetical protein K2X31_09840 [Sphingopyxis sp.]|nr:hypothetical protein [Sphingopyxis sp.]
MNELAPNRSEASDGAIGDAAHASRASDHNPWVHDGDTEVVTALDLTHDPAGGCDAGTVARAIVARRDSRVKYVICNRRIANSSAIGQAQPWAWREYSGSNRDDKHAHVSVHAQPGVFDGSSAWNLADS